MRGSKNKSGTLLLTSLAVVTLLVLWLLLGLPPLDGSHSSNASQSTPESSSKPSQVAYISLYPDGSEFDTHNWPEPQTVKTGVQIKARGNSAVHYEGAVFCYYDENGTRLGSAEVGPIVSPESGGVQDYYSRNITVSQRPKYAIVDHPKLRNGSIFRKEIRIWDVEQSVWVAEYGTLDEIQDRFEWPRTNEVGTYG